MILEISAASDKGKIRNHNEDMILVERTLIRDEVMNTKVALSDDDAYVVAIADGIGGSNAGEKASEEALKYFCEKFYSTNKHDSFETLSKFIDEWATMVNSYFQGLENNEPSFKGLGTTMTGIIFGSKTIMLLNCGDSRVYRMRNGILTQLTTDHSLEQITHNQADKHIITNAISADMNIYFDKTDLTGKVFLGDTYLLCSDGLSDMLSDEQIETLIANKCKANEMVQTACDMGGKDNISVCIVNISEN